MVFIKDLLVESNGKPQSVQLQLYSTGNNINIQLSCKEDLFFLYTLDILESEFLTLKSQQNLLVDFTAFPEKLIDLLNSTFSIKLDLAIPMLRIIETNTFKHITHIELVLVKASDASIKKYLSDLVTKGIDAFTLLSETSASRINALEKCKGDNTGEIGSLSGNVEILTRQIQEVKTQHSYEMTRVNEEGKSKLDDSIRRNDTELRQAEAKHQEEIRSLTQQLTASQTSLSHQSHHASTQQETLLANTKQIEALNQDIATIRYDNEKHQLSIRAAEKRGHELELAVQKYREGKERAERRIGEVEENARRTDSALEGKNSGYAVMEKQVWDLQASVEGLEERVRNGEDEIRKANTIIQKLQGDLKAAKSKLKLKNEVMGQQEKLLDEKAHSMDLLDKELGKLTESIVTKQEALAKAVDNAESLEKKLVESKEIIRDNNHVIEWLHRQLNESALATDFDRYAGTSRGVGHDRPGGMAGPKPDIVVKASTPRYSRPPTAGTSPARVYHSKVSVSQVGTGMSVTGAASGSGVRGLARGGDGGVKSNYFSN